MNSRRRNYHAYIWRKNWRTEQTFDHVCSVLHYINKVSWNSIQETVYQGVKFEAQSDVSIDFSLQPLWCFFSITIKQLGKVNNNFTNTDIKMIVFEFQSLKHVIHLLSVLSRNKQQCPYVLE